MRKGPEKNIGEALKIVFEDEWLIVVEKPSGLLTMSTGRPGEVTAYSLLNASVKERGGKKGSNNRIFIVHRLDRDTSGLLVFAKDEQTKHILQENWEEMISERRYIAVLEGKIDSEEGWIESWLYENPKTLKMHCYAMEAGDTADNPPRNGWVYASTRCRTMKTGTYSGTRYTMTEFCLETGRKNQLRIHSSWIGHPIAGDRKYGATTDPAGRLALHAAGLTFTHPYTGKRMTFRSNIPRSFKRLVSGHEDER